MIFARYLAHGNINYGVLEGQIIKQITTSPFEEYSITDHIHPVDDVKILPPSTPSKILAIGLNYHSHLQDRKALQEPLVFYKTPTSIIGPEETIVIPKSFHGRVDEEGELVVIMKDRCKNVTEEDALKHILGYTCGNDVSAREWQRGDGQWWRAKSSDTFSPVGPYIATDVDHGNVMLRALVNGQEVQAESTAMLIFSVPTIISFISQSVTLEPGDMIFTGTPGHAKQIGEGDIVEIRIEGIGTLRNHVSIGT